MSSIACEAICSHCIFFRLIDTRMIGYGRCVRYPPQNVVVKSGLFGSGIDSRYPEVFFREMGCGEFKPRMCET